MAEEYDLMPVPPDDQPKIVTQETDYPKLAQGITDLSENISSFFKGGLYQVMKDNGAEMPGWMDTAHKFLNNPDLNEAIGMTSGVNVKAPITKGLNANSPWVKFDVETGSHVYDPEKIDKVTKLFQDGATFQEMADRMDVTRGSIAGILNRLGLKRGDTARTGRTMTEVPYEHTWSTQEMAAVRRWDQVGAGTLPEELARRGIDQVKQKLDELAARVDKRFGDQSNRWKGEFDDYYRTIEKSEAAKARREGGIHYDRIPEIKDLLEAGESLASVGRKLDIPAPSVRELVRKHPELRDSRQISQTSNWTAKEDKIVTDWYNDPKNDLFGTPKGLEHRSPASIERRIKTLKLDKAGE